MVAGAMEMSIGFYNNQNICFICMRLSKKYLNESDKKRKQIHDQDISILPLKTEVPAPNFNQHNINKVHSRNLLKCPLRVGTNLT